MTPEKYFESFKEELAEQFPESKELQGRVAKTIIQHMTSVLDHYDDLTSDYLKEEFGLEYFSAELQNMESDFRWVWKLDKLIEDYYG